MKVCLVTPEFPPRPGGLGASVRRISTGLNRYQGHEAHVLAFNGLWWKTSGIGPRQADSLSTTVEGNVIVHRVHPSRRDVRVPNECAMRWVGRLHGEYGFDLLVPFNLALTAFPVTLYGRQYGIPVAASSGGLDVNAQVFAADLCTHAEWVLMHADRVHTVSSASLRRANALVPLGARGLTIVNHIAPGAFDGGVEQVDLPSGSTVIATAGIFRPLKGLATLLDAIAALKRAGIAVLLIGDARPGTADAQWFRDLVERYRKHFPIAVTGVVPHRAVLRYMRAASIFVISSSSEGGPNTLLEAMLATRPIVTTDVGMVPDVLRNGVDALVVPPDDSGAMSSALRHLIDNPPSARTMAEHAYRTVTETLSPQREAAAWDAMLHAALDSRNYSPPRGDAG